MHIQRSAQEVRDQTRHNMRTIAKSMIDRKHSKTDDQHVTYEDALKEFLHVDDQRFCASPAFRFLCIRVKEYLESEFKYENWQALVMAIDNFKDYMEKMRNE